MKNKFIVPAICTLILLSCNHINSGNDKPALKAPLITTVKSTNSIYQLKGDWTNQENKVMTLNAFQGNVQVIAMIFTNCQMACPRITSDIKKIETDIPAEKKNKVGFVLVSFDTERDTSQQLKLFYDKMDLDTNWSLLHGDEDEVRQLSVLLNVSYKKGPKGIYSHSNIITVLDPSGVIQFQQEGLAVDDKEIVGVINKLAE